MRRLMPIVSWFVFALAHIAQGGPGQQVEVQRGSAGGSSEYGYLEYLPPTYNGTNLFPLVIFNHGLGESGTNYATVGKSDLQLVDNPSGTVPNNINYNITYGYSNINAIVISPQFMPWAELSETFVQFILGKYKVDTNRVYMTGLSMGGGITWKFARAYPQRLAAIVPVCGQPSDSPWGVQSMTNLPIWAFHNEDDGVVVWTDTTLPWVNAISNAGGHPLMTIYPYAEVMPNGTTNIHAGHNAWSYTYARQDMWDWMFAQSRAPAAPVPTLRLSANAVTDYVVVAPSNPTPADGFAVSVLTNYLKLKTSVSFPVVTPQNVNGHPKICVGLSAATTADLGANPTAGLGTMSHVAKNIGSNIYLYGKDLHGSLYAVVDFLDHSLGRQWCVPNDNPAPTANGTLSIPSFSRTNTPSFPYRMLGFPGPGTFYYEQGCNLGLTEKVKADWGLPTNMVPAMDNPWWAHTSFFYIPPQINPDNPFNWLTNVAYFSSHPEWYSMNSTGQRVADQLCYSSPGLRAQLTSNILYHIQQIKQENRGLPILISVEQQDPAVGKFCYCAECGTQDVAYASDAGAYFDYLRELSTTVQAQHPDVKIKMIAYRGTQTRIPPVMPSGTSFPSNVVVLFCPYEDVLNKTWLDPRNSETYNDLVDWTELTPHVWVWRYYLYSGALLMPFLDLEREELEMGLMKDLGVKGAMYEAYPEGGLVDLLMYLYLKLAQNADSDIFDHVTTFCATEYGPAAATAEQYIDGVDIASQTGAKEMTIVQENVDFSGAFSYLTDERIRNWQGLFDTMMSQVGSDTRLQANVTSLRRTLDFATLGKWRSLAASYPSYFTSYAAITNRIGSVNPWRRTVYEDFLTRAQGSGVYNPLPSFFNSCTPGSISELVPLNQSTDGSTRSLLDSTAAFGYGVTVNTPGLPVGVWFFQDYPGAWGASLSIPLLDITPNVWTMYHLGQITLTTNCHIYMGDNWLTALDLGPKYRPTGGNQYDAYVSLKFLGTTYGGTGASMVLCDRVVLIDQSVTTGGGGGQTIRLRTATNDLAGWTYDAPYVTNQTSGSAQSVYDIRGDWRTVNGTTEQALYNFERFGNFSYDVPVSNGQYAVKLHLAELAFINAGARVFDVTMEGAVVLDNYDIVADAGAWFVATQKTFNVTVADGHLNMTFAGVTSAAKVGAIEIIPAGP